MENFFDIFIYNYGRTAIELIAAFAIILIFLRLFGLNNQLKQMTTMELIINLILGGLVSGFIFNDNINVFHFMVVMLIYIMIVFVVNLITKKTNWGRRIFVGVPRVIIKDGKIDEDAMAHANLTVNDIAPSLRGEDVHSLEEIKLAQIEPGGNLTVVKRGEKDFPVILIDDGVLDKKALKDIKKSELWLRKQLRAKHLKDEDQVFVALWYKNKLHIEKKS